ncbi:MAG TPA: ribonuclease T2 [Acidobacteriaceae bacterium]|jgi:ribonuclease T2|nr:ribonuclease T2 [Acidobacteriaceae bacterium]
MKHTNRSSYVFVSFACVAAFALLLLSGCRQAGAPTTQPSSAQPATESGALAAAAAARAASPIAPGNFDYYLLTLSWAPEYCHGHRNSPECNGDHPGFVVHGLWPQFQNGRWPSQCSSMPGLADPSAMLDLMPDPRLIAHEWSTHGTCTGLTARQYFSVIRQAYNSIKIPPSLVHPSRTTQQSATAIKQLFIDANPELSAGSIAVSCHNRYLAGVEFCLSKSLQPIACQAVRDCDQSSIRIPAAQ